MKVNVLKDFETFYEFPDKYIRVTRKSNYYYIRINDEQFITKMNIDLVTNIIVDNQEKIRIKKSYYNVIDGSLVLKTDSISDMYGFREDYIGLDETTLIQPLNKVLNIKGNGVYYLSNKDIENIVNYKEECAKTYNNTPRRHYF